MSAPLASRSPERQRGAALVVVILTTSVLSLLLAGFIASVRSDTQIVNNRVEIARSEALFDAALNRAVLGILAEDEGTFAEEEDDLAWHADGRPYELDFAGAAVTVRVLDENARIDLNLAGEELIAALADQTALDADERVALAAAILDWRDGDELRRVNGAEDLEYRQAGLEHGAGDAPFLHVSQLRKVLGVTPSVYETLAPMVTVNAGQSAINPVTAPAEVLRALPGVRAESVERVMTLREEDPIDVNAIMAALAGANDFLAAEEGPVYAVIVEVETAGGFLASREALIWVGADEAAPFRVLEWRLPLVVESLLEEESDGGDEETDEDAS